MYNEEGKNKFINITPDMHKELKEFCDEHGLTLSGISTKAITKYMAELITLFEMMDKK